MLSKSTRQFVSAIQKSLLLATLYFLLGIAGLQLAIAPGYATAIFPAAGAAFAAVLYGGGRLLPGIWLGSIGINLWVAANHGDLNYKSLLLAAVIGLGSTLQAWIAASLVLHRLKDSWRSLDNDHDIISLLFLSGPLACLISATWGNIALILFHMISAGELFFNWWNWWVGDTIGVLLFAPLSLMVLEWKNPLWKSRFKTVAFPSLMITAGIIAAFVYVSGTESQQFKQHIAERGLVLSNQLRSKLQSYEEIVTAIENLVKTYPNLSFSDFEGFSRQSFVDHPYLQALSWNPVVKSQAREQFETDFGRELQISGFKFTQLDSLGKLIPAEQRNEYIVVQYITPFDKNRDALGFDIASDAVRQAAVRDAIQTGKPVATAPIRLVQEQGSGIGILLLQPVYFDQLTTNRQTASGPETPFGFAVGAFRVAEMLKSQFDKELPKNLALTLEDKGTSGSDGLLYRSGQIPGRQLIMLAWEDDIPFNGRLWHISIYPTPEYMASNR